MAKYTPEDIEILENFRNKLIDRFENCREGYEEVLENLAYYELDDLMLEEDRLLNDKSNNLSERDIIRKLKFMVESFIDEKTYTLASVQRQEFAEKLKKTGEHFNGYAEYKEQIDKYSQNVQNIIEKIDEFSKNYYMVKNIALYKEMLQDKTEFFKAMERDVGYHDKVVIITPFLKSSNYFSFCRSLTKDDVELIYSNFASTVEKNEQIFAGCEVDINKIEEELKVDVEKLEEEDLKTLVGLLESVVEKNDEIRKAKVDEKYNYLSLSDRYVVRTSYMMEDVVNSLSESCIKKSNDKLKLIEEEKEKNKPKGLFANIKKLFNKTKTNEGDSQSNG